MALRKRNISKKKRRWILAHYATPRLVPQSEVLKRCDMEKSEFYTKFYQIVIDMRDEKE